MRRLLTEDKSHEKLCRSGAKNAGERECETDRKPCREDGLAAAVSEPPEGDSGRDSPELALLH
jgi:hypothetical protein